MKDIRSILEEYGLYIQDENDRSLICNCPYCFDPTHFWVLKENGRGICWKCNYSVSLVRLLQDLSGLSFYECKDILKSYREDRLYYESTKVKKKLLLTGLPFIPVSISKSKQAKRAIKYLLKRGLSMFEIKFYYFSILRAENGLLFKNRYFYKLIKRFKNFVFIPIFNYDGTKPIYFVARNIKNNNFRYFNPNMEEVALGKNDILFNIHNAKRFNTIYITEGIFSAIAIGINSVSLLGKTISDAQIKLLKKTIARNIIVCLDGGEYKSTYNVIDKLYTYLDKNIYFIQLPLRKDPADLNKEERKKILKLIKKGNNIFNKILLLREGG